MRIVISLSFSSRGGYAIRGGVLIFHLFLEVHVGLAGRDRHILFHSRLLLVLGLARRGVLMFHFYWLPVVECSRGRLFAEVADLYSTCICFPK